MKEHLTVYAIRMIRLKTGLTQQEYADKYGIPIRTLQNWECGHRVPPEYVEDLLKFASQYNSEWEQYKRSTEKEKEHD